MSTRSNSVIPSTGGRGLAAVALFLDVDGTLLDFAQTPDSVQVDSQIVDLLRALALRTGGAIAFVSGRPIWQIDELFAPLLSPAAGLHGFERRNAEGKYHRRHLPAGLSLEYARQAMHKLASQHPGLLVEDKCFALALHYRRVPMLASIATSAMNDIAALVTPELELQYGKMVVELRPPAATKGSAVREFLQEPPFRGRWPIYIGDDLTDETAFQCVNDIGGLSIGVNISWASTAQERLPDSAAVRAWLRHLLKQPAAALSPGTNGVDDVPCTPYCTAQ